MLDYVSCEIRDVIYLFCYILINDFNIKYPIKDSPISSSWFSNKISSHQFQSSTFFFIVPMFDFTILSMDGFDFTKKISSTIKINLNSLKESPYYSIRPNHPLLHF